MSDLVGNPEDRFSRVTAFTLINDLSPKHFFLFIYFKRNTESDCMQVIQKIIGVYKK